MTLRIGDAAFTRDGFPTVVKDRNELTSELTLNREPVVVSEAMRHGYINGLNTEERSELYQILDVAKEDKDPNVRIDVLKEKVAELEKDPTKFLLAKYVRSEMVHIMNSHGIKPKEYTVLESKVR